MSKEALTKQQEVPQPAAAGLATGGAEQPAPRRRVRQQHTMGNHLERMTRDLQKLLVVLNKGKHWNEAALVQLAITAVGKATPESAEFLVWPPRLNSDGYLADVSDD